MQDHHHNHVQPCVNLLLRFCFSIIHWKRVWLVFTRHILSEGRDRGIICVWGLIGRHTMSETGSPSLLQELYGPSTLFSIAPSPSLFQRTRFLISFIIMGVIFWHPPVALLSRDEANCENRHGNLLCEWKLRNALKSFTVHGWQKFMSILFCALTLPVY